MTKTAPTTEKLPVAAPTSGLPIPADLMSMMEADVGMGVSTDPNDVGIPFLYILQDLSPQVKKRDEAYIEGAEVGDIYNNVTKEVIPASVGLDVVLVGFESAQVEWKPNRGGFVAKHAGDTPLLAQVKPTDDGTGRMIPTLPNGNILTETRYHYGMFRRHGSEDFWEPCVFGMASTMLKVSREIEGIKRKLRTPSGGIAPSFSRVFHFSTTLVKKNNNEWFVWKPEVGRYVTTEEYVAARDLAVSVQAGKVRTADPGTGEPEYSDDEIL